MKRQHTTVAIAIVLFLAVRIIGAAFIKAVSSPFSLPLEILCMLLSAALPACLFIGGQSGARVLPRAPLLHRSHLRYLLLLPVFIVSVSLLATVFTYLAELCGYSFSLQLPKEIPDLFLLAVILPALVEEFFCRHLCFAPFAEQGATSAIWISAILFALLHVNFLQIPYAFFAGLFLGALAALTNSILLPTLFHLANNLVSVCFSLFGEGSLGAKLLEGSLLALAAISIPFLLRKPSEERPSILAELWETVRPRADDGKRILDHLLSPLLIPILLCLWLSLLP